MNRFFYLGTLGALLLSAEPALCGTRMPVVWERSFGGTNDDALTEVIETSDHGFIISGDSNSSPSGNKTATNSGSPVFWVVRLDPKGKELWQKTYGGDLGEFNPHIRETPDHGFILAGSSNSGIVGSKTTPNYGAGDVWVVRLDAQGNQLWDRDFGGTSFENGATVDLTPDGGFIIGASSFGTGGNKTAPAYGNFDYWLIRLDADGNKLWDHSFGGAGEEQLTMARTTSDGGFIVGGYSSSEPGGTKTAPLYGGSDFWVVRLDAEGNKVWEQSVGGDSYDYLYDVIETRDGRFVLAGGSASGISGNKTSPHPAGDSIVLNAWLVMLDSNGTKMWDHSYGGAWVSELYSVTELKSGGFVTGGMLWTLDMFKDSPIGKFGEGDAWIIRTDDKGRKVWNAAFGSSGLDSVSSLSELADGGLMVGAISFGGDRVGNKRTRTFGRYDYWLIKLGPERKSTYPLSSTRSMPNLR